MNRTRRFVTVIALLTLGACASQPVVEIKDAFKRATEAITGGSESDAGAEAKREGVSAAQPIETAAARAPELSAAIDAYENGRYAEASRLLRSALPRFDKSDQVVAHKYLAFIACTSGRRTQCRDEFRLALKLDPAFDLEPAEAGHPVWGPVFRSVKHERRR